MGYRMVLSGPLVSPQGYEENPYGVSNNVAAIRFAGRYPGARIGPGAALPSSRNLTPAHAQAPLCGVFLKRCATLV